MFILLTTSEREGYLRTSGVTQKRSGQIPMKLFSFLFFFSSRRLAKTCLTQYLDKRAPSCCCCSCRRRGRRRCVTFASNDRLRAGGSPGCTQWPCWPRAPTTLWWRYPRRPAASTSRSWPPATTTWVTITRALRVDTRNVCESSVLHFSLLSTRTSLKINARMIFCRDYSRYWRPKGMAFNDTNVCRPERQKYDINGNESQNYGMTQKSEIRHM